jgi:formylglycine-generating enzyme required for sulfatase activity
VTGSSPSEFVGDSHPVERVSWDDIQGFLREVNGSGGSGYRLPSEAEWEYACRAKTTWRYGFGDADSQLEEYGWYGANSLSMPHPVGQKRPNAWGLYDMHGNVWEWCSDSWRSYYTDAPRDGSSWESGRLSGARVLRGGSWVSIAGVCRSARRYHSDPSYRRSQYGFRLARSSGTG